MNPNEAIQVAMLKAWLGTWLRKAVRSVEQIRTIWRPASRQEKGESGKDLPQESAAEVISD
jgi:hypothetical protein